MIRWLLRKKCREITYVKTRTYACQTGPFKKNSMFIPVQGKSRWPEITVTDFIARLGKIEVGSVHLINYPQEYFPFTGYWLFGLQVSLCYRGLQIGEELSRLVIMQAGKCGAKEILLLVGEKNKPAKTLYEKLGFKRVSISDFEEILKEEKKDLGYQRIVMCRKS